MERPERGAGAPELEQYAGGFVAWLGRLGYSPKTCEAQVALLRHLGRWLAQRDVPLSGLGSEVAGEYAAVRRERSQLRSERALRPVLSYLRELGAVPPASAVVPHEPVDVLLARFGGWLSRERGLAPATVSSYLYQARLFADACAGQLGILTAAQVTGLATAGAGGLRPRSAQVRANAVRALLRFAWLEGLTAVPLAGFVGSFAAPAGPAVPKGLSPVQAAEFLAFVRAAPGGLRNEPMMALLLRLALRAGEAAGLLLDDIAWRQGVITVRGKGNRSDQVPLPADVGGPLARYLRDGRPAGTAHRQVFLALDAPHAPVTHAAVTSVAGRAPRCRDQRGRRRAPAPAYRGLRRARRRGRPGRGRAAAAARRPGGDRCLQTLQSTAEAEFLRYRKLTADARDVGIDPADLYDMRQLGQRTDRMLPNGYCLLPPRQVCGKGNACLTCDKFATDASFLPELNDQLQRTGQLIGTRQAAFTARTGTPMSEDNVWLAGRRTEQNALHAIITELEKNPGTAAEPKAVRGAGTTARTAPVTGGKETR